MSSLRCLKAELVIVPSLSSPSEAKGGSLGGNVLHGCSRQVLGHEGGLRENMPRFFRDKSENSVQREALHDLHAQEVARNVSAITRSIEKNRFPGWQQVGSYKA